MSRPLISVITSTYNMALFVRESVESALAQTWDNIEVIVVDDGSTDDTRKQLEAIDDHRVRCYFESHRGHAAAANTGIAASTGSYVAFLDADDLWAPTKIETHLRFHEEHPEVDMTFSLSSTIDEHGRALDPPPASRGGPVGLRDLLVENLVRNGSASVLRRDALDRAGWFDPGFARCLDLDLWLRIALLSPDNIHCIPQVLTQYRRWSGQLTTDWRMMRAGWDAAIAKVRVTAPALVDETERAREVNNCRYFASLAYEGKRFAEGLGLLWTGFHWSPLLFLRDSRNLLVSAACLAGLLLPAGVRAGLDQYARGIKRKAAAE